MDVWYWGGRYIPWVARLMFFFWAGSYAAWRLFGLGSTAALLTGAVVALVVIGAGEVGQFRSRREAVLRREADPRLFDAVKSEEAVAFETALIALGFSRRGDCVSTKGNALVRRRIFVDRQRRTIVAVLFHTCALVPAEKGKPKSAPEERSAGPTTLSMVSYGMNGSVVRSRATAPGDKPMRPIARELVQDFPSASPAELLDEHARRIADIEARDRTRMIEVDEWSAFALADALDDAWARRIESFGWTPMAYRMLIADVRWFRDMPFIAQAAAVLAVIFFGPGLLYLGGGAFQNHAYQMQQIEFTPTALGARFDATRPPVYPGAVQQSGDAGHISSAQSGDMTAYTTPAPMETVRRWYEDRMPGDATELMAYIQNHELYRFMVQRPNANAMVVVSRDPSGATDININVRQ
jgi:hypothetical protein